MCQTDETYFLSDKQRIQLNKELNVDGIVEKAINQLYDDRKIDDDTRKQLIKSHYEPLKQAVNEGYNAKVEYGTPNYNFLKELQTNTAVFAAFKNHASVKEMTALLKDSNGNLRGREDFKKEALKVDADYRGRFLDAEYNTAVSTARSAAQWQEVQRTKHLYPNLTYLASSAAHPRDLHRQFYYITRPVDDPFWDAHTPPLDWVCKCRYDSTRDEQTDIPDNLPTVPKEFAFNPGKTGQVFNLKETSYIKTVPIKEQPKLIKEATAIVNNQAAKEHPYTTLYNSKNGGSVETHPLSFRENDFDNIKRNAISLANAGKKMQILPIVEDPELRQILLPKEVADQKRTPDYFIDESFTADLKIVKGLSRNSIKRPFSEVKGQSENVIIEIPKEYPFKKDEVIKMIKNKMNMPESKDIKQVWVNYKGKWIFNPHKK